MLKKSTKLWLKNELKSHFITIVSLFLTFLSVDGIHLLVGLYNWDWTVVTVDAVILLVNRSIVKTVLTLLFPAVFPQMKPEKQA